MNGLISALSSPCYNNKDYNKKAKEYFDKLSELRKKDYYQVYPALKYLKDY